MTFDGRRQSIFRVLLAEPIARSKHRLIPELKAHRRPDHVFVFGLWR